MNGPEDVLNCLNDAERRVYRTLKGSAACQPMGRDVLLALGEQWTVAMGYSELSDQTNTCKEVIQDAIHRLIKKLFLDIVEKADAAKLQSTKYRVYTLEQVHERHRRRGIRFYRKVGGGKLLVKEKQE
jgi:hypothetical protein